MDIENLKKYSPIAVRIGISLVFLWFGISQLIDNSAFTGWVPSFISNIISASRVVLFNGIFETIFGLLLLLGLFTRLSSLLLALHLIGIVFSVGYNEIGVRDFGLFMAALAIFLNGKDDWCLDNRFR